MKAVQNLIKQYRSESFDIKIIEGNELLIARYYAMQYAFKVAREIRTLFSRSAYSLSVYTVKFKSGWAVLVISSKGKLSNISASSILKQLS